MKTLADAGNIPTRADASARSRARARVAGGLDELTAAREGLADAVDLALKRAGSRASKATPDERQSLIDAVSYLRRAELAAAKASRQLIRAGVTS